MTVNARSQAAIEHLKKNHPQWVDRKTLFDETECPQGSSSRVQGLLMLSPLVEVDTNQNQMMFRYNPKGKESEAIKPVDKASQKRAIKAEVFKVAEPLAKKYPCDVLKEVFAETFDFLS